MNKKKIALLFVCVNPLYWPFLKDVITDCQERFLNGHQVDYFAWSDMPELGSKELEEVLKNHYSKEEINGMLKKDFFDFCVAHPELDFGSSFQVWSNTIAPKANEVNKLDSREKVQESVEFLRNTPNIKVFPTEPVIWPYPTLMRYHLFLQQEEILKDYDYIFYLDADMRVVGTVGDEILGEGITMAEHPMYALRREYIPPYEPNPKSTAYISRFGCILTDEQNVQRFKPLYAAGGFQGGTAKEFIPAMKQMRDNIDKDFNNNYIAIWNDESHWNKWLSEFPGHITVLSPSYVYPDSLIEEYYVKAWGTNHEPKIVTLTKKFSVSREGGENLHKKLSSM